MGWWEYPASDRLNPDQDMFYFFSLLSPYKPNVETEQSIQSERSVSDDWHKINICIQAVFDVKL